MKITKRILTAVLSLVLLASCFALAISASGETAVEDNSYLDVLEYYETTCYVNEDFSSWATKDDFVLSSETTVATGAGFSGTVTDGVAALKASGFTANGLAIYFDVVPDEIASFGFNVRMQINNNKCYTSLSLHSATRGATNDVATELFKVLPDDAANSVEGKVTLLGTEYDTAVAIDSFFDVQFFFELDGEGNAVCTVTVTPDGAEAETHTANIEAVDAKSIDLRFTKNVSVDYIEMYEGSFARRLSDNEDTIAACINDLVAKYDENDADATLKYLETAYTLVGEYGYDVSKVTDEVLRTATTASISKATTVMANVYIGRLSEGVGKIDTAASYTASKAFYDQLCEYNELIKTIEATLSSDDLATVTAAREKLSAEKARLEDIGAKTVAAIEFTKSFGVVAEKTYKELYDAKASLALTPICPDYTSDTVTAADVAAAEATLNAITDRIAELDAALATFKGYVTAAYNANVGDSETKEAFKARYDAYVLAKANFFEDTSYDECMEPTVANLLATYNAVDTEMKANADAASRLSAKVNAVRYLNYFAKATTLTALKTEIDAANLGYPGVEATVNYYNTLVAALAKVKVNGLLSDLLEYYEAPVYTDLSAAINTNQFGINVVSDSAEKNVTVTLNGEVVLLAIEGNKVIFNGNEVYVAAANDVKVSLYYTTLSNVGKAFIYVTSGDTTEVFEATLEGFTCSNFAVSSANATVEAYNGSFIRELGNTDVVVAQYVNVIVDNYVAAPTAANRKAYIYPIYDIIVEKEYTTENITDATLKAKTDANVIVVMQVMGDDNAQQLVNGVGKINSANEYNVRLDYVNSLKAIDAIVAMIETDYAGKVTLSVSAEDIASARARIKAESDALENISKFATEVVNTALGFGDVSTATYKALREAKEYFEKNTFDVTFYDATISATDVNNAIAKIKAINDEYARVNAIAEKFVTNVILADNTNVGDNETVESFKARYNAFVTATENYFTDTTYNEYIEAVAGKATTIEALIEIYGLVKDEMELENVLADLFIQAVIVASHYNFFEKCGIVDDLAALAEGVNVGYPGVSEAMAIYESIKASVEAKDIAALADEFSKLYDGAYYIKEDFNWTTSTATSDFVFDNPTDAAVISKASGFKYTGDGSAIAVTASGFLASGPSCYFDVTPEVAGSFGVNMRVNITKANCVASITSHTVSRTNTTTNKSVTLFQLTPSKSELIFCGDTYETSAVINQFVTVSLFYELTASGGANVSLTLTFEDGTTEVYAKSLSAGAYKALDIKLTKNNTIDYLEVYEGTFIRSLTGSDPLAAKYINDIVAAYNADPTVNYLEGICNAVRKYGFDINNITDDTLKDTTAASLKTAFEVVVNSNADKIVAGSAAINTGAAYNDRLNYYTEHKALEALITYVSDVYGSSITIKAGADNVAAALDKFEAEKVALDKIASDTKTAYDAVVNTPDLYFATYQDLYDTFTILGEHKIDATFYDETYTAEEIANAVKLSETIIAEYNKRTATANAFVENVKLSDNTGIGDDETPESFKARYDAYLIAKANKFTDVTYNAFLDEVTIEELVAIYDSVNTEMNATILYAETFIRMVREAQNSLSYSVKRVTVEEAAEYLENVELGYPGVAEAIALYGTLADDIVAKDKATTDYITAVLDIAKKTTFAEKKAAIAAAEALAAAGSDISVEVVVNNAAGEAVNVTAANIILSNASNEILLAEIRISNFVNAVDAISAASDLTAKREAIFKAASLRAKADATESSVVAAAAKLDKAVSDYNASVAAANSAVEASVEVAVAVASKTVPTKPMNQVVAIIKKFFE